MAWLFSRSSGLYYNDAIHPAAQIPADAAIVTDAQYQEGLAARAQGLVVTGYDASGNVTTTPRPPLTGAALQAQLVAQAKALLADNDEVYIRCGKAGVAYPANWQACDVALRAFVDNPAATNGVLPQQPKNPDGSIAYPAGS